MGRAFTYLMALQVQAIGLILLAWWGGDWLNKNHPISFNWYILTFTFGIIAVAHTFYVVVRHALDLDKKKKGNDSGAPPPSNRQS